MPQAKINTADIIDGAVSMAKIAQAGATSGQAIAWNGSAWAPATVGGGGSPSVITPSQITATQNDYAPTGWGSATVVRLSGDSSFRKITGFSAETDGEEKILINVGSNCLYIAPQHTGSVAANRVDHYEEIILVPGGSVRIWYDGTALRWKAFANTAENYQVPHRAVWYDKFGAKFPEGITEDSYLSYGGSGNVNVSSPTSSFPFARWSMDNNSLATGDKSLYLLKTTDALSYAGAAHVVTKCEFNSFSSLSDGTNQYRIRFVMTASPATLLTNVNSTCGIRYSHDINSGKFQCYCRDSGGTETTADSGVTYAVNTVYSMLISLNKAADEATFFINGAVVARITTNLPASTVLGVGIQYGKLVGTTNYTFNAHRLMGAAIMV